MKDINNLSNEEASRILQNTTAAVLISQYQSYEIEILVNKTKQFKEESTQVPHFLQSNNPLQPPSVGQQAVNFGKAMVNLVKDKGRLANDDVYWNRLNICRTCTFWIPPQNGEWSNGRCSICGCYKGKHKIASSICPHNPPKWYPV